MLTVMNIQNWLPEAKLIIIIIIFVFLPKQHSRILKLNSSRRKKGPNAIKLYVKTSIDKLIVTKPNWNKMHDHHTCINAKEQSSNKVPRRSDVELKNCDQTTHKQRYLEGTNY